MIHSQFLWAIKVQFTEFSRVTVEEFFPEYLYRTRAEARKRAKQMNYHARSDDQCGVRYVPVRVMLREIRP